MKTTLVSAANAPFFPLLSDLLASIEACRPDESMDVCILDVGLTSEQRHQLLTGAAGVRVARIVEPDWDVTFPVSDAIPSYLRALTARPFLPRYFPEYDRFVFLDADTWLQDWRAVEALLHGSDGNQMAVVPELHHTYLTNYRLRPRTRENLRKNYAASFGDAVAADLITRPVINSGVWALGKSSPAWGAWAKALQMGLCRQISSLTEQCALNFAIYSGWITFYPLPAWCNWICSDSLPAFSGRTGRFFTPSVPRELISILHLNDYKNGVVEIPCFDGTTREMSPRYSSTQSQRKAS